MAELVLCGTLYGENVTYMVNHTLPIWLDRIYAESEGMRYDLNITVKGFEVVPHSSWNFAMVLSTEIIAEDEAGLCYYKETNKSLVSLTSIVGLEDPLYPLYTNNRVTRFFYDCDPNLTAGNLDTCSEAINVSCYVASNATGFWDNCSGEHHPDGPSFFDRLDGRLELSDEYRDQAVEHFGNPSVGLETIVDLENLEEHGIETYENASWVDYLYWADVRGEAVEGVKPGCYLSGLRLDCPHAYYHHLNTTTVTV